MSRVSYESIGPSKEIEKVDQESLVFGNHIFKPELECVAVLIHYLGSRVDKKDLVMKMIGCDFHLDAIEKVKSLDEIQYEGFVQHIDETLLNTGHSDYVGQKLLDDFKDHCTCCSK